MTIVNFLFCFKGNFLSIPEQLFQCPNNAHTVFIQLTSRLAKFQPKLHNQHVFLGSYAHSYRPPSHSQIFLCIPLTFRLCYLVVDLNFYVCMYG